MMHLICFGDSICYGYAAQPGTAWVEQVATKLAAISIPVILTNAGVNGDTTEDALRRMKRDVEDKHPDAVYVQFGLNDCSFWCGQHGKPWLDKAKYIENMQTIVARSFACGSRIVFVATNHPVAGEHLPFDTDEYQHYAREYNEALREVFINQEKVIFVDMEHLVQEQCREYEEDPARYVLSDCVHLSRAGNTFYAETLYDVFISTLG